MAVIDQHDNFSNVSWHSDSHDTNDMTGSSSSAPVFDDSEPVGTHHPEMEEDPTRIDPGLSGDILDCTVTEPRKESDGTKDAFVSYLVMTNVSRIMLGSTGLGTQGRTVIQSSPQPPSLEYDPSFY